MILPKSEKFGIGTYGPYLKMYHLISGIKLSVPFLALLTSAQSPASNFTTPIVNLGYVSYSGYQNSTAGITYYRGVPYAQPPTGELRWQKPRPIEGSNNFSGKVVDATTIAPACYQSLPLSLYSAQNVSNTSFIATPQGQSEDCLTLDVLVPSKPVSGSLPVLVQIHGGGYTAGNGQSYPGDALVNASNGNIIYVYVKLHSTRNWAFVLVSHNIALQLHPIPPWSLWLSRRQRNCI